MGPPLLFGWKAEMGHDCTRERRSAILRELGSSSCTSFEDKPVASFSPAITDYIDIALLPLANRRILCKEKLFNREWMSSNSIITNSLPNSCSHHIRQRSLRHWSILNQKITIPCGKIFLRVLTRRGADLLARRKQKRSKWGKHKSYRRYYKDLEPAEEPSILHKAELKCRCDEVYKID